MDLPTEAVNFDVGNACLGFLNGMNVVAAMIEQGEIEHGIVVDGETSRFTMEATIARLAGAGLRRPDVPRAVRHADAGLRRGRDGALPRRPRPTRAGATSAA